MYEKIPEAKVFFISQEKFNFAHFFEKLELVSKKCCFFFPAPGKKKQPFEIELVSTI